MLVRILEKPPKQFYGGLSAIVEVGEVIVIEEGVALDLERHGYAEFVSEPVAAEPAKAESDTAPEPVESAGKIRRRRPNV